MARKCILWDFDGTLAWRDGVWGGALIEVLRAAEPDFHVTKEDIRPHLQAGFPWHSPEIPHPELCDGNSWWKQLLPVFEQALEAIGFSTMRAAELAALVPMQFCRPEKWHVFEDVIPTLTRLSQRGWSHVILSNHVPELPAIVRALGIDDFFVDIHTSARTGYEKPHSEAFLSALRDAPKRDASLDDW